MNAAARPILPEQRPSLVASGGASPTTEDSSIGEIIRRAKNLTTEQIDRILDYQRSHRVRFGEATVALGYANEADILYALSQQFSYPYVPEDKREVNKELVAPP